MHPRSVLLGQCWIWFSAFGVITAALAAGASVLFHGIFGNHHSLPCSLLSVILLPVAVLFAIPGIMVGRGLMRGDEWARIPAILLAVLMLFHFPIGTALAVFTFVVLFGRSTTDYQRS